MSLFENQNQTFEELRANFRWRIPEHYNIGVDVCDKHADRSGDTALFLENADGRAYSKLDFHAAVDFEDVVRTAVRRSGEPGPLTVEVSYTLPANPFAFAAHVAVVNLDRGTGEIGRAHV